MQSMPTTSGTALTWTRIEKSPTTEFTLTSGQEQVARLRWEKSSGSLAHGESVHGKWTFKRVGFFATHISVRREGSETDLAVFVPNWKGDGRLTIMPGKTFLWKSTSFWKANYTLTDEAGHEILSIKADSALSPKSSGVIIGPRRLDETTLSMLAILAMYVGVLARSDEDAGALSAVMAAVCS